MTFEQRIDTFLEQNLERYLDEVIELCAQPSVSARGEGLAECAHLVVELLRRHGLKAEVLPTSGSPVVVGQAGDDSTTRTLLFYNHYDVQPPEPLALWTSPPFRPAIREGVLYARGARDDKGEIVARLAAMDAVRVAHHGRLPTNLTFVIEGQEEVGSPHIAGFVREHRRLLQADGLIWEEGGITGAGRAVTSLGVRGILFVELRVRKLACDAHSGAAHLLPSAAWRLLQALGHIREPDGSVKIPGFYDRVCDPSDLDLQLLDNLPPPQETYRHFGATEFVGRRHGRELNRALFSPTCNLASLTAAYQGEGPKTIIPAQASAKLDFRLVPEQDPSALFEDLKAYLVAGGFSDVDVRNLGSMWPTRTDPAHPLVRLAS